MATEPQVDPNAAGPDQPKPDLNPPTGGPSAAPDPPAVPGAPPAAKQELPHGVRTEGPLTDVQRQALKAYRAAFPDETRQDPMIAALLRERQGYLDRGLDDRVEQVNEQLRLRDYDPEQDDDQPARGSAGATQAQQPRGRRAPGRSKT